MKFTKLLCLVLALLMTVACFVACGGDGDDTTLPQAQGEEDETGRNAVKDTVPADLKFNGETVTFFVRDDSEMWKNEIDVEKTTNDTLFDSNHIGCHTYTAFTIGTKCIHQITTDLHIRLCRRL